MASLDKKADPRSNLCLHQTETLRVMFTNTDTASVEEGGPTWKKHMTCWLWIPDIQNQINHTQSRESASGRGRLAAQPYWTPVFVNWRTYSALSLSEKSQRTPRQLQDSQQCQHRYTEKTTEDSRPSESRSYMLEGLASDKYVHPHQVCPTFTPGCRETARFCRINFKTQSQKCVTCTHMHLKR